MQVVDHMVEQPHLNDWTNCLDFCLVRTFDPNVTVACLTIHNAVHYTPTHPEYGVRILNFLKQNTSRIWSTYIKIFETEHRCRHKSVCITNPQLHCRPWSVSDVGRRRLYYAPAILSVASSTSLPKGLDPSTRTNGANYKCHQIKTPVWAWACTARPKKDARWMQKGQESNAANTLQDDASIACTWRSDGIKEANKLTIHGYLHVSW